MPSLAAQLAQNASLNAAILTDRSKRKPTASYLFTGRDADLHDLETIHALGLNALLHLTSIDPSLAPFEDSLFSEQAKETDRTLLGTDELSQLDDALVNLLWTLGPHLLEAPTGRVLEWLVRRFRVNEFHVQTLLALFLPYHESPHFTKMLSILHIKPNSTWSFLLPFKAAAQKLHRVTLVTEMLKNIDVARFIANLQPKYIQRGILFHSLVSFNAATLHEFIKRSPKLDDSAVAFLFPAILEPLQKKAKYTSKDAILGSYILLSSLSQKCTLSPAALTVAIDAMTKAGQEVEGSQLAKSLVALCEPQEALDNLSELAVNSLATLLKGSIGDAMRYRGSQKFLAPFVQGCVSRLPADAAVALLEEVIFDVSAETTTLRCTISALLAASVDNELESSVAYITRQLLSTLHQRRPMLVKEGCERLLKDDESQKDALEQLQIAISLESSGAKGLGSVASEAVLASSNTDAAVRCAAVKELKTLLSKFDDPDELKSVTSALLSRLQDTEVEVLQTLYDKPEALTSVLTREPNAFISALELAISSSTAKPKRAILRTHISYLFTYFWPAAPETTQSDILHRIVFPLLLFTKARQKSTEAVWTLLGDILSSVEWLRDCSTTKLADVSDSTEGLVSINSELASKIADNILASSNQTGHLRTLLLKLTDNNVHTKLFAFLTTVHLLHKLDGKAQIQFALEALHIAGIRSLSGVEDISEQEDLMTFQNLPTGKAIVTKPHSQSALAWTQISLIFDIARIRKPDGDALDWFSDKEPAGFVGLFRQVYTIANASPNVPVLASSILRSLFASLQDEALVFLAGVWSSSLSLMSPPLKKIALLHAAAFLEAHVSEGDGIDFQTVLPALLVSLTDQDRGVREGALNCIARIRLASEGQLKSVYRFDAIYGSSNCALQYLDQSDSKQYLSAILDRSDHFLNDPSSLNIFHSEYISRRKDDKKKDSDYKHRIACFLLSHVNALPSDHPRKALLDSLSSIAEKARATILLPTLQALAEPSTRQTMDTNLLAHLLSSFDGSSANALNSDKVWDAFIKILQVYLRPEIEPHAQAALTKKLRLGVFDSLNNHKKLLLCETLLSIGAGDSSNQACRDVLSAILKDAAIIINLLRSATPQGTHASSPVVKRVKTSDSEPQDDLSRLTLLAEILANEDLPGSLDLITRLLDSLNTVTQNLPPHHPNISYIQQLLMSAVENCASNVTSVPNISPSVIRLEILVELIRVSGNPQTFQQALLLMANLARLAPESVLFNIMPIFTFMGSNVFHRDDSYSFKVVQQTIDGIVPVMAASLKRAHTTPLELYVGSREFLRVFTDAATHIPRHRRNNFFAHFIDVLGVRDFLAPVCMLLIERSSNKVIRQPTEDVQSSLSLPIAIFQQAPAEVQRYVANQCLIEAQRLVQRITQSDSSPSPFLEVTSEGDHSVSRATLLKRRAQALILFVGYALKGRQPGAVSGSVSTEDTLSQVVASLISLSSVQGGSTTETNLDSITEAARSSIDRLLKSMSATDFIESVEAVLPTPDVKVRTGALELLASRLPEMSTKARGEGSPRVVHILGTIKAILDNHKKDATAITAFRSLRSIAETLQPGEEGPLTAILPIVVSAMTEEETAAAVYTALPVLCTKLGPRIIPFFRGIVSQTVKVLREPASAVSEHGLETLTGLLSTIPTFWGNAEVSQIVYLQIDAASTNPSLSAPLSKLIKTATKKVPAKIILPTLLEIWSTLKSGGNAGRIEVFYGVVGRCFQHAERNIVMEHLRAAFGMFLEAFEVVADQEMAEAATFAAFKELVVKLNETSFKPLFRRLYDWAFASDQATNQRKALFGRLYTTLLDFFKSLLVPYTSFLLTPYIDTLQTYLSSKPKPESDVRLWHSIIKTLSRTFEYDDGLFWRSDRLDSLLHVLSGQVDVCVRLSNDVEQNDLNLKEAFKECLTAYVESASDHTTLKKMNVDVLMHTRNDDARVRVYALGCAEALWRDHGHKLVGFVGETSTFIAECGEDENDLVVRGSFRLKEAVESVAGKIDDL